MVDPGGLSDHLADAKLMSFNPNIGLPSVTNGHYTPAINTEGWAWLGKWIPCSAHGAAEGLRAAYGDGVASSYEETTGSSSGNDDNNSSTIAGNYGSGAGSGQGSGGPIPTMVLPDGEVVAIDGSFDHTADMNPNDVTLNETQVQGRYSDSYDFGLSNWSGFAQAAGSVYSSATAIPGAALGFVTETKAGKLLSMGGSYVWKSSSYSAQRELANEMAAGSEFAKGAGKALAYKLAIVLVISPIGSISFPSFHPPLFRWFWKVTRTIELRRAS